MTNWASNYIQKASSSGSRYTVKMDNSEQNRHTPLSRTGAIPLYHQVAEIFRQRVYDGTWKPGDILPSLDSLMAEFSVARVTIREAVRLLRDEGLLLPERGRGTVVTQKAIARRPLRVETTMADLIDIYKGDKPNVENIEEGLIQPSISEEEGLLAPSYYHLKRTHMRSDMKYCIISLYIEETVFRRAEEKFRTQLVLPVLYSLENLNIANARQRVTIGKCDIETAELLEYPIGDPVAKVRRLLTKEDNEIVYLADVIYRADCIRFDMDMKP